MTTATLVAFCVPFLGTALGAAFAFFMKHDLDPRFQKALLGFAAGVMIAASVWSLLIPAIEAAEADGQIAWVPALIGFLGGIAVLLIIDHLLPHQHIDDEKPEGIKTHLPKSTMLVLAITLHNLPEGMAVGVVLAGFLSGQTTIGATGVITLAVGIAIQNIPEGAIVSMPLATASDSKLKAFGAGVVTGVVEPLGAALMVASAGLLVDALPYVLAFAAGAMIYVVVEELIPESQDGSHSDIGTIGVAVGFALMMVLDVALG